MTTMTTSRGKLQRFLWDNSLFESVAAEKAWKFGHSGILRPEERDYALDVIYPDEVRHTRLFREAAEALGSTHALGGFAKQFGLERSPDLFEDLRPTLVRMNVAEKLFVRYTWRVGSLVQDLLPAEFGERLQNAEFEERGHVVWGNHIISRWLQDDPEFPVIRRRYLRTPLGHPRRVVLENFRVLWKEFQG